MPKVSAEVDLPRTAADAAHDVLETCGLLKEIRADLLAQTSSGGEYMRQGTNCCLEVFTDLLAETAQLVTKYRDPELARQRQQAEAKQREQARLMSVLRQDAHDQHMKLAVLAQRISDAQKPLAPRETESKYHALLRQKAAVEAKLAESEQKIHAATASLVMGKYKFQRKKDEMTSSLVCEYCKKEIHQRYEH
jgi:hypothetical protein